jgi:restriction endonuclease S subunit
LQARDGCFAVRRGQAHRRADVNYNLLTEEVNRRLAHPRYELAPVSSFEVMLQYGCSTRATEDPIGYRMLRMNNLQKDGWHLEDLKYVQLSEEEFMRWRLERGDIVFNRTNSKELVGKCEVFDEPGDWVFASYLMRLRVNHQKAIPHFVTAFLNTRAGRAQIDRESRQIIGMSNINAEEIRTLRVPLPQPQKQEKLLKVLDAARARRKRMLDDADSLLVGLDSFVLDQLGIILPPSDGHRTTYAVRLNEVTRGTKLNPDFFHPERISAIKVVQSKYPGNRSGTLASVADFRRDLRRINPSDAYLGLANVQPNTGETIDTSEEDGEGAVFEYAENDVLFARLRPYLNKVYRAETGGVCSTEFHVMRVRATGRVGRVVMPDYLAAVLRSSIVLSQTRHMMTGNTHPRLTNEDVVNLVIPIPDDKVQSKIAAEVARRRVEARRLRGEADALWETAKGDFEAALLGPISARDDANREGH